MKKSFETCVKNGYSPPNPDKIETIIGMLLIVINHKIRITINYLITFMILEELVFGLHTNFKNKISTFKIFVEFLIVFIKIKSLCIPKNFWIIH